MAHKSLISGTAYEIAGGNIMNAGSVYGVAKGRTLVNGVGYDIEFQQDCKVTIVSGENDLSTNYRSITINGVSYEPTQVITVPAGTIMSCYVYRRPITSSPYGGSGYVYVNGNQVFESSGGTYDYTINGNITVELCSSWVQGGMYITEE